MRNFKKFAILYVGAGMTPLALVILANMTLDPTHCWAAHMDWRHDLFQVAWIGLCFWGALRLIPSETW